MCLSPQSARLRSDLHEETKTCFRGIPCTPSPLPLSHSLSSILHSSSLSRRAHTLRVRGVRTRRKEELAQRDSPRSTLHFTMAKILCKASACTYTRTLRNFLLVRRKRWRIAPDNSFDCFSRTLSSLNKMDLFESRAFSFFWLRLRG